MHGSVASGRVLASSRKFKLVVKMETPVGKRKELSNGSSSSVSSVSPSMVQLDKKARNQSEESVEDEVVEALNLRESMGVKINTILLKLEKLDMLDTITHSVQHLEEKLSNVESTVHVLEAKLGSLEANQTKMEKKCQEFEEALCFQNDEFTRINADQISKVGSIQTEVKDLEEKLLYLEAYGRRENLIFHGINEDTPGHEENTREIWAMFLKNNLGVTDPDSIEIQRIHRLPRRATSVPRPIIARFLRFADREHIWSLRFKLKGSRFQMYEDFPRQIIEERRKLIPKMKEAHKEGKKAAFSKARPNKLYIEGRLFQAGS